MQSREVVDALGGTKSIITATIEDEIIFIVSPSEFDLNASETVVKAQGFDTLRKGVTLKNTKAATLGATSTDHYFWGTTSNALKLGGIDASNFIQTSGGANIQFTQGLELPDAGILIGDSNDLQIKIDDNGYDGVIQNVTNNSSIKFKVTTSGGTLTHVATINDTTIVPAADNTFSLGSASLGWSNVYAANFTGEASTATALRVGSEFRTSSVSASNNTVAVRDATGNIAANLFQGTATQARYADLAEKYSTAEDLAPGTVVCVGRGEAEVEPVSSGCMAIGVVSTDPALMMNSDAEGQYIGLKGRLPVRVVGSVTKGDAVYVDNNGCAGTAINGGSLVGVALESNSDEGEKLVECVLKV